MSLLKLFGFLVTFACGWLNVGIFLQFEFGGTHQTGTLTRGAMTLFEGQWGAAISLFGIIFAFILGAACAGFISPEKDMNYKNTFGVFLIIGAVCVLLINALFYDSYIFDFYGALFAGFQNGFLSQFKIRVSHVSGCCTDAGVNLGRFLHKNKLPKPNRKIASHISLSNVFLNLMNILCFFLGVLFGMLLFSFMEQFFVYLALFIWYLFISIFYFYICYREKIKPPEDFGHNNFSA